MFDSSPITSWEGAGVFGTFAETGVGLWVILTVVCCIIPLFVTLNSEKKAEEEHKE